MRRRTITTLPCSETWYVFDELEPGDDNSIPGFMRGATEHPLTLEEWNEMKASAIEAGEPVLIFGGRKPWTREQLLEALETPPGQIDGDITFS